MAVSAPAQPTLRLVLRSRTPQAIADVSRVHLDEEPAEELVA